MAVVKFTLNGQAQTVDAVPTMPLLWVLRDTLGLTGTKFGCGMALCGACTVHVNGQPMRSCMTPVVAGRGQDGHHHRGAFAPTAAIPCQRAWIEEDVPQCGYCQSGQIMTAAALLAKTSAPTDADIDEAMRGNICRCGTYEDIRRAIHRAARVASAPREVCDERRCHESPRAFWRAGRGCRRRPAGAVPRWPAAEAAGASRS